MLIRSVLGSLASVDWNSTALVSLTVVASKHCNLEIEMSVLYGTWGEVVRAEGQLAIPLQTIPRDATAILTPSARISHHGCETWMQQRDFCYVLGRDVLGYCCRRLSGACL